MAHSYLRQCAVFQFAAMACLILAGCRSADTVVPGQIDWRTQDGDVQTQILERIPSGTSEQEARAVMEQNGFKFLDKREAEDDERRLIFRIDRKADWAISKTVFATFAVNEDDSVSLVEVKSWMTGP